MIWNNEKMAVNLPLQNLNGSQHPRPCFDSGLWHGFRIKLLNNDSKIHPKVSSVTYFLFVYLKSLVFQISLHDLPWNDPLQFRWEKHKVSPRQDHLDAPPGTPSSLSPGSSTGHTVQPQLWLPGPQTGVSKHCLLYVLILKTHWVRLSEPNPGAGLEHQHFDRLPAMLRNAVRDSALPTVWEQSNWGEPGMRILGSCWWGAASMTQVPVVSVALPAFSASAAQNPP